MARPIWKGQISFGLVNIPVTLFSAEKKNELSFKMIDSRNNAGIKYERKNEETGEEVPWDAIVKGFQLDDGQFVLLEDEDFKKAAVEATQTVEIEDFVDLDEIDYEFFEKPYYMVPAKKGEKGYVLLRETLKKTNKVGIARVVIRTKQYLAAVIARKDALILEILRFADEIRGTSEFNLPGDNLDDYKVSDREIKMAEQLVGSMESEWEPEKYRDEYRDALMKFIEEKADKGEAFVKAGATEIEEMDTGIIDIMDLLKKSIDEREEGGTKRKKA